MDTATATDLGMQRCCAQRAQECERIHAKPERQAGLGLRACSYQVA